MKIRSGLIDKAGLVGNEDIGRYNLNKRPVGMAPFALRPYHQHAFQTAFANARFLAIRVFQTQRAIRLTDEMKRKTDRHGNDEMTPVEIYRGRAMLDGF